MIIERCNFKTVTQSFILSYIAMYRTHKSYYCNKIFAKIIKMFFLKQLYILKSKKLPKKTAFYNFYKFFWTIENNTLQLMKFHIELEFLPAQVRKLI